MLSWENDVPYVDTAHGTPSEAELAQLLRLVLGVIAKSEANDAQIHAMQTLPYEDQMILMRVIEATLAGADAPETEAPEADTSIVADTKELETVRRELAKQTELATLYQNQLASVEAHLERIAEENKEMAAVVRRCMPHTASGAP